MIRNEGVGRAPRAKWGFPSVILLILLAFVASMIAVGTVWAFASGKRAQSERSLFAGGKPNPSPEEVVASSGGATAVFADIGPLRAATADKRPVTIVITPFMPYKADDLAFREELVKKTRAMRSFILDWFRSRTVGEIGRLGEAGVKESLVDGINGMLVLGSIDSLYFGEYMVLE
jgi:flagellar protein FliL